MYFFYTLYSSKLISLWKKWKWTQVVQSLSVWLDCDVYSYSAPTTTILVYGRRNKLLYTGRRGPLSGMIPTMMSFLWMVIYLINWQVNIQKVLVHAQRAETVGEQTLITRGRHQFDLANLCHWFEHYFFQMWKSGKLFFFRFVISWHSFLERFI